MLKASDTIDHAKAKVQDGKTLSDYNVQKESSVLQDINEVHGVVKKLGVEHRSHRDGRAQGPGWPDYIVRVQLRRAQRSRTCRSASVDSE